MAEEQGQSTSGQSQVYAYIDDPKRLDDIDDFLEAAGLSDTPEVQKTFDPVLNLIADGRLDVLALPARIVEKMGVDPARADELAKAFASAVLVPLGPLLPSVAQALEAWKVSGTTPGVSASIPLSTPEHPTYSANAFVHEVLASEKVELPEPHLQKKLEQTLAGFVAKASTREETLDVLVRPRKIGGLALDPRASEQLLDAILEDAHHFHPPVTPPEPEELPESDVPTIAQVLPEPQQEGESDASVDTLVESPSESLPEPSPVVEPSPEPVGVSEDPVRPTPEPAESPVPLSASSVPVASLPKPLPPRTVIQFPESPVSQPVVPFDATTIHPDDEKEVAAHQEKVPQLSPVHDVDEATRRVMKTLEDVVGEDETSERWHQLHAIVKTRLKGIRDPYQTRSALESKDGLALTDGPLSRVLEVIEDMVNELDQAGVLKVEKEREAYVQKRVERFQASQPTTEELASAPVASEETSVIESDTSGTAVRAPSAVPVRPLPVKKKEKIRDIVAPRTLSGPVEELGAMTLADFRRMGSTPDACVAEVTERIGLLEGDSYAKRLAGIAAWRKSPLMRMYTLLLREALEGGQPLLGILEDHRASGEDVLTQAEVQALSRLNGTLRV